MFLRTLVRVSSRGGRGGQGAVCSVSGTSVGMTMGEAREGGGGLMKQVCRCEMMLGPGDKRWRARVGRLILLCLEEAEAGWLEARGGALLLFLLCASPALYVARRAHFLGPSLRPLCSLFPLRPRCGGRRGEGEGGEGDACTGTSASLLLLCVRCTAPSQGCSSSCTSALMLRTRIQHRD